MTVAEMIEKLKTFPQDLPVCIDAADGMPDEGLAEKIERSKGGAYYPVGCRWSDGDFLQIG